MSLFTPPLRAWPMCLFIFFLLEICHHFVFLSQVFVEMTDIALRGRHGLVSQDALYPFCAHLLFIYGKRIGQYQGHFFKRAVSAYLVTFCVALLLLILFDKAPLHDLKVTLTRTILVAFPSSFAATAVDFVK